MTATPSFSEADALRHVTAAAGPDQLRTAVLAVIEAADSGGYVDEVRDLKHLLWTALTTEQTDTLDEDVADLRGQQPEIHAVTGTHHKADARAINLGRRGGWRYVGFQTQE